MSEGDLADEVAGLRAELAAERLKGEAFAELSHELRTLIAGVVGLTTLLLDTELTAEQRDYVKRVRGFSDALVGVVNNVLDWSRIEAGRLELDRVDLDVRRLVDEVGELCADRARAKGVELVMCVAADVPSALRGDPARLRQVLMNLVSNALKFTERGEVVLRAAIVSPAADDDAVVIRFEVRDTGVGISPEGQERLFRPFMQVHAGDGGSGSGLGLALSKQIVVAMGGAVGVESTPGRGSTFHFTARLERRAGAERSAIPRVDMAGHRVLVAVANASTRACLAEMLAPLGVELHEAEDGGNALTTLRGRARAGRPCGVVLLDVSMQGASGLMRALDADDSFATLPVVLLAYPGQRWDEPNEASDTGRPPSGQGEQQPRTTSRSDAPISPMRTGPRAITRVITHLAKPVRQSQLHACLRTLTGGAVETVAGTPESRRGHEASTGPRSRSPRDLSPRARSAAFATPTHGGIRAETQPTPPPPSATDAPLSRRSPRTQDGPRVLLVEDNAVNQRVAKLMMEKRGYVVDVASDGHEAVAATGKVSYAAVLMDCHMPRLDGYSATTAIRQRDRDGPRVPIIAMTANAGPGARERCLAAGMDDYVAKPVTAEGLHDVLRRWITARAATPTDATALRASARPEAPQAGSLSEPAEDSRGYRGASAPRSSPVEPRRTPSVSVRAVSSDVHTRVTPVPEGVDVAAPRSNREPPDTARTARVREAPTVDLGMLRKLRGTQRDPDQDIVTEVVELFLQDAPVKLAALREAASRGDLTSAARTAHTLKGSSGHLGAKALALLCSRFEERVRAGTPFNTAYTISAIAEELERVRAALAIELHKRSGTAP